ncbi:hypothetical protein D3C74_368830 [compost metagenome]
MDRGQRRPQLVGGISGEPPHLLFGFTLIMKGNFQPLQHPVEGLGELVDFHLSLVNGKADVQITGIDTLRRIAHIG